MGETIPGFLIVTDNQNVHAIKLIGGTVFEGLQDKSILRMDTSSGKMRMGGNGKDGSLRLYRNTVHNAFSEKDAILHLDGERGNIWLGGNGKDGDLVIFPAKSKDINDLKQATIHMNGEGGSIELNDNQGKKAFSIFSNWVDEANKNWAVMDIGRRGEGESGRPGFIGVVNDTGERSVTINGSTGDIHFSNADCAEEFDSSEPTTLDPGTVMVIGSDGRLQISSKSYDKRVAGVISGAGNYRSGIVLDKNLSHNKRVPVALIGKVNCKVDADYSKIKIGDMLTTSASPGHAMKATDCSKAFGSVIGKALKPLKEGRGMIPVLVALQ